MEQPSVKLPSDIPRQSIPQVPEERKENDYLGHTLTPEGWKETRWLDGKEVEIDPLDGNTDPIKPLPKKFRDKHRQTLMAFIECVAQVKQASRTMPILREELIEKMKFDKQIIKDLVQFGYIDQRMIPVEAHGRKLGGRAVLTPSLEARKLHRAVEDAMKEIVKTIPEAEAK